MQVIKYFFKVEKNIILPVNTPSLMNKSVFMPTPVALELCSSHLLGSTTKCCST